MNQGLDKKGSVFGSLLGNCLANRVPKFYVFNLQKNDDAYEKEP